MAFHKKPKTNITKLRLIRLLVQLIMFILMNLTAFGIGATWLMLPINMPQTLFSSSEGAFYVFQRMLTSAMLPLIPIGIMLILGAIFGRMFCAWACPFGMFQDMIGFLTSPFQKYEPTRETNLRYRGIGETIAIVTIIGSLVIGFGVASGDIKEMERLFTVFAEQPWAVLSPATFLFTGIPLLFYWEGISEVLALKVDVAFWIRGAILLFAIVIVVYVPRGWCRWFCPIGAIQGALGKNSLIGISRNITKCDNCGICEDVCTMGVRILQHDAKKIRSSHCTLCLDCVSACPQDALEIKIK